MPKPARDITKKKKLSFKISYEHRGKNSQKYIGKLNPVVYRSDYISWPNRIYSESKDGLIFKNDPMQSHVNKRKKSSDHLK
jgi:hypothetical protein